MLTLDKELKKRGRGATDHRVEDSVGVVANKWYDNKPVTLLSTFVGVDSTDSVWRWDEAKKEHVQVYGRSIVKEYNKFMGGVDLHDSLTALYKYPVRSKRWYIYNLTMVVVNACLLYHRRHCGRSAWLLTLATTQISGICSKLPYLSRKACEGATKQHRHSAISSTSETEEGSG